MIKPKQFFVFLLAFVLLFIAGSGYVYLAVHKSLKNDMRTTTLKHAELQAIDSQVQLLKETEQRLEELSQIKLDERIDELLPTSKNQTQAIQQLFSIFNQQNIPIDSLSFTSTEEKPEDTSQSKASAVSNVWAIPITVSFNDAISYAKLKQLLYAIEGSSRHITLQSLQVAPASESGDSLTVSLVVHTHYVSSKANATPKSEEEILKQIEASTKGESN